MSKSDDEDFRRNRRRHQNREAARRCRQRRRDLSSNLLKEYQGLQSTNTQLMHEIRVLEKQKQKLDECLGQHTNSCSSAAVCRSLLPMNLPSVVDAVNYFGESSSTTTSTIGHSDFLSDKETTGQQETCKTGGTAGLTSNSVADGLDPFFRMSSTTLSFAPMKNFLQRDRSPLKRSSGLERRRLTKGDGMDYGEPKASEPRIIKDTMANGSTADSLCFAFNEGDSDVISGDSNLSTMSVGRWLQDA